MNTKQNVLIKKKKKAVSQRLSSHKSQLIKIAERINATLIADS